MLNKTYHFPRFVITDEISLRELDESDSVNFYNYSQEIKDNINTNFPNSLAEADTEIKCHKRFFYVDEGIFWAIENTNHQMVGQIGIYKDNDDEGEIAFEIARNLWRKGIMTSVLFKVLDYAFNQMKLTSIYAKSFATNLASIALLKKFKFIKSSEDVLLGNKIAIFALTKSVFLTQTQPSLPTTQRS
jgi:[ribosomal protein S5]-alanine N-acetyltransferase